MDDKDNALHRINPGWRFDKVNKVMVFDVRLVGEDSKVAPDLFTFKILQEIANLIHPLIQWMIDCPSMNEDGKVPCLDLKVWVENGRIKHQFFKKSMASPFMVLTKSALPSQTKRATLFMECMRHRVNCSTDLP